MFKTSVMSSNRGVMKEDISKSLKGNIFSFTVILLDGKVKEQCFAMWCSDEESDADDELTKPVRTTSHLSSSVASTRFLAPRSLAHKDASLQKRLAVADSQLASPRIRDWLKLIILVGRAFVARRVSYL